MKALKILKAYARCREEERILMYPLKEVNEAIAELEALSCDNCKYNIDVSDLSDEESLNIKENCLNCCNFYTNKKEI